MQTVNYGLLLDRKLEEIRGSGKRPKLLLHACCAPCSSYVLEYLNDFFDISLYFFNPNISPESEYEHRKSELVRLADKMCPNVRIFDEPYDPEPFFGIAKGLEDLPERGLRCQKCIALRLSAAGRMAAATDSDYFTTTLTVSPHKDSRFINECGGAVSEKCGVPYLFSDFKKHDGYRRSIELSREYGLYRQNYCGCVYSEKIAAKV